VIFISFLLFSEFIFLRWNTPMLLPNALLLPLCASHSTLFAATAAAGEDPASQFLRLLTVFLLAMWVGFEVITKVPQRLHTPLTSGSNAISGITVVGALVVAGALSSGFGTLLGLLAVVLAMINVVGGFVVTHRMLEMFSPKKK
jgi:NAD(P) transhydrogenase subunit alpha